MLYPNLHSHPSTVPPLLISLVAYAILEYSTWGRVFVQNTQLDFVDPFMEWMWGNRYPHLAVPPFIVHFLPSATVLHTFHIALRVSGME